MEEFDDDEFSDLYADVVVQASSAISAMHRLTEMRPNDDKIFENATGREEVRDRFYGAVVRGNHKICERVVECEDVEREVEEDRSGGLIDLPMENGDTSRSESEDNLDSGGDNRYKQKFDDNCDNDKYDNRISDYVCQFTNMSKDGGEREIEEDEKNVKCPDYHSQGKSLEYDSLSSKKRRVDEMARNVHKLCKKGDADAGGGELCFRREGELENLQPNLGRKCEVPNNASESCRPLDLDKCGSVQISDSVEDNHREVSDSDLDGTTEATETSYDTNRRKTSCISNKVSSEAESASSESSWSRHGRGPCSRSPSVALSDKYTENSHKRSKYPSSNLSRESQEGMTRKDYPSTDFRSHGVKESTSDGRYREIQRGNSRNHYNQHKKSDDMLHYLNARLSAEDSPYAVDLKRHYNRHFSHGKQKGMCSFNSYENDVPYCSQSKRFATYLGGFCPDYPLGPPYLENQNWNIHPSSRYKAGLPDAHNISARHRFLDKNQMDYEAMEDGWYHNRRRHPVHRNIKGSRNLTPKYSFTAVNQRGTRFISKGDGVHFRKRTKGDNSLRLGEYDNKFVEAKYKRICPSGGRDRNNLDDRCDRNVSHNRRDMESSRRGIRRHGGPLNNSGNIWYTKSEVIERRNIKLRPSPFYSSEEPCAYGPQPGIPERKFGRPWKEMHIESGRYDTNSAFSDTRESLRCHHFEDHHVRRRHYQQSSNTYFMEGRSNRDHDEDNFVRNRHHRQAEILHSREEVNKSRQQDDTMFHSKERSYHFEKTSSNKRADDRHAFGHAVELINEEEANRERSKMVREQDSSNQFDGYHKSIGPHSHVQMYPRCQDSVDELVVVGRKPYMEAGEHEHYGTHDLTGLDDDQKSKNFEDSSNFHPVKAVTTNEGMVNATLGDKNQPNKFSESLQDKFLDIEEGQIITEEIQDLMNRGGKSKDMSLTNGKGQTETASNGNGEDWRLDDEKIREIMVKMERRRERFKEPITISRDSVKTSNLLPDLDNESGETKLERPARKRRWSGK